MFKSNKKKQQEILKRQKEVKTDYFDFERISLFFSNEDHQDVHQIIDDRIMNDLDLEDLFISLDRTSSSIGQQYLYSKLNVLPKNTDQLDLYEQYIRHLNKKEELKDYAILELSKLNNQGAYFLQRLFFTLKIDKPKWAWLMSLLSVSVVASLIVSVFYPSMLLMALLIGMVNTLVHYWNKNNILGYSNTIPQLLTLHQVASNFSGKSLFLNTDENVESAIQKLNKVKWSALFFRWESTAKDEMSQVVDFLMDLIKGIFLIEPIVFFRLMDRIEENKAEIKTLYEKVGELDMMISLSTWRESLPYYCTPQVTIDSKKIWHSEKLYHPLIENPETNDFSIEDEKSIVLSGSNMSGKTTFIRTLGINAILAQALNTACAQDLHISRYKIHSAIRITDDILDNTSYYYEEVKTIKSILEESKSDHFDLILLDEIFKGTNTIERIASGKAVLSYLNNATNLVVCSTHDLELIDYLKKDYQYYHFEENIENGQITFDYKLKEGSLNNTNAIRILELNEFPTKITDEAKSIALEMQNEKLSSK